MTPPRSGLGEHVGMRLAERVAGQGDRGQDGRTLLPADGGGQGSDHDMR